jgi:septal ring factor EnvC (AmiA/AmiB activator)
MEKFSLNFLMGAILVLLVSIICFSCKYSENEQSLMSRYAEVKCQWVMLSTRRDSMVNLQLKPLEEDLRRLKNEKFGLSAYYDDRVTELSDLEYLAGNKNTEEYNRISRKHEEKYGHLITPDYQKAIDRLEREKAMQFSKYDSLIRKVNAEKENDLRLQELNSQIKSTNERVKNTSAKIRVDYGGRIDELEKSLRELKTDLKSSLDKMDGKQRDNYSQQLIKIEAQPCLR